jgi:DinB superfamily
VSFVVRGSWFGVHGSSFVVRRLKAERRTPNAERRTRTTNVEPRTSNGYDRRMTPITPYSSDLDNREPIGAMRDTTARVRALAGDWRPDQFDRSYDPGKWDARQILIHLAQSEIAFGYRVRMALASPGYMAQSFDQDRWMSIEAGTGAGGPGHADGLSGHDALDAFLGLAAMNIGLFASLSAADRTAALSHPEYGTLTVDWIIHQTAGHQIHHLKQLEQVAAR